MVNRKNVKRLLSAVMAVTLSLSMCMNALALESAPEAPGDGTSASPSVTVTVTVAESTDSTTGQTTEVSTTEKEWTGTDGEPGTTVSGEETTVETTVSDPLGRPVEKSGTVEGSQTTEVTTSKTEENTENGVLIDTDTETGEKILNKVDGKPETTEGEWVKGGSTNNDNWVEGAESEGQWSDWNTTPGTTDSKTETDAVIPDPLGKTDITINLTPGGTDQEKVTVSVAELLTANGDKIDPDVMASLKADADGKIETKISDTVRTVTEVTKDSNGNITGYKVTTYTTTTGADKVVGVSDPVTDESTRVIDESKTVQSTPTLPADLGKDDGDTLDADGNVVKNVTTKTEPIYSADGKTVIGYTITKTTTEYDHDEDTVTSQRETGTETHGGPQSTFALPEKPAESTATDDKGVTTTVTVEELKDDKGDVVGYKSTTVKTNASGKELSRTSESVYGTTTTVTKTTVTDPTHEDITTDTKTVTTEVTTIYGSIQTSTVNENYTRDVEIPVSESAATQSYQLVNTENGLYYIYEGQMWPVQDFSSVAETPVNIVPDKTLYNNNDGKWQTATNDIQGNGDGSSNYAWYMMYSDSDLKSIRNQMDQNDFVLVGYGLFSEYEVYDDQGKPHSTKQYVVMDKSGNLTYTYCVELGKALQWGNSSGGYVENDIVKVGKDNQITFENEQKAITYISSVANNGFWGTTDGVGSLEAVKDLLIRNGYKDVADSLTAGQALAATQAAVWKYGTKDSDKYSLTDITKIKEYYYNHDKDATKTYTSADDGQAYKNIDTLYNLLTSLAEDVGGKGVAQQITKEDITAGAIVIKDKVAHSNNNDTNTGNDVYNTDVAFTLAVSTSSINGDLLVHVYTEGSDTPIATRRLAGDSSGDSFGKIYPDKNGQYTIEDIQLQEGVKITLNLDGTQHLTNGVYVYECSNSQNFMGGLTTIDQDVNLKVDMKFTVTEPNHNVKVSEGTSSVSRNRTDTRTDSKVETRTDTRTLTTTETDSETIEYTTTVTEVYADVTVTEVTETSTSTVNTWESSWSETYTYSNGNDGDDGDDNDGDDGDGDNGDGGDELIDIGEGEVPLSGDALIELPEEEVPLADIPVTGDASAVFGAMSAFSAFGLAVLQLLGRKKKDEE